MTNSLPNKNVLPARSMSIALQDIANKTMFDSEPDLILNSFPRSGNTFLHMGIRMTWPNLVIKSHLHDIHMYKEANGTIPFISVVRTPLEAISSWVVHAGATPHAAHFLNVDNSIRFYEDHLTMAMANPNVMIVPFEDVSSDIISVLETIAQKYNLDDPVIHTSEDILLASKNLSQSVSQDDVEFAKRGHVPRTLDPSVNNVREILNSAHYKAKMLELESLYNKAISNSSK
jgi:hypothetical protein